MRDSSINSCLKRLRSKENFTNVHRGMDKMLMEKGLSSAVEVMERFIFNSHAKIGTSCR